MNLYEYKAYELSEMLRKKEISSVELTNSVYDRIESVEPKVEAYLTLNKEAALKSAAEIDRKITDGEELSRLAYNLRFKDA